MFFVMIGNIKTHECIKFPWLIKLSALTPGENLHQDVHFPKISVFTLFSIFLRSLPQIYLKPRALPGESIIK
jgi:hypothetical protein